MLNLKSVIGMSKKDAEDVLKESGMFVRVSLKGIPMQLTEDVRADRVTIVVSHENKVVDVISG